MNGTWNDVNRRLTSVLLALDLDDSIVVGERRTEVRKGLLGSKKVTSARPRRYIQVTAGRDRLTAECVGSTSFGGEWAMTPGTEAELIELGWQRPWSPQYPTFWREGSLIHAPRLARASVRALQVMGAAVADLEAELVHEEPGG